MAAVLTEGTGPIPIPSVSQRGSRGLELVATGGRMNRSWNWSCHLVLCGQSASEVFALKTLRARANLLS